MPDYFKGTVEEVISEETLLIGVEFVGESNQHEYGSIETVQIKTIEPPFLKNIHKEKWKVRLEKKLKGVTVYCYLLGKTKNGTYNAKIVCEGPEFRGKRKRV